MDSISTSYYLLDQLDQGGGAVSYERGTHVACHPSGSSVLRSTGVEGCSGGPILGIRILVYLVIYDSG